MHWPGIEPGPPAWQARILPLNHQCYTFMQVWFQKKKPTCVYTVVCVCTKVVGLLVYQGYMCSLMLWPLLPSCLPHSVPTSLSRLRCGFAPLLCAPEAASSGACSRPACSLTREHQGVWTSFGKRCETVFGQAARRTSPPEDKYTFGEINLRFKEVRWISTVDKTQLDRSDTEPNRINHHMCLQKGNGAQ